MIHVISAAFAALISLPYYQSINNRHRYASHAPSHNFVWLNFCAAFVLCW